MFKDLPIGETHSFDDGCGEPAHNKKNIDWRDELFYLVEPYCKHEKGCLSPKVETFFSNLLKSKADEVEKRLQYLSYESSYGSTTYYPTINLEEAIKIIKSILK